jgi:hypothetical protein
VLLDTVYIPGTQNWKTRPIVANQTHLYYCTLLNTETMVHNAVVLSTTILSVTFIIIMHMLNVVKLNLIMQIVVMLNVNVLSLVAPDSEL